MFEQGLVVRVVMKRCSRDRREDQREEWVVNHVLVYKLMDRMVLESKVRAKQYNSYKGLVTHIANNVLDRRVIPDETNTSVSK